MGSERETQAMTAAVTLEIVRRPGDDSANKIYVNQRLGTFQDENGAEGSISLDLGAGLTIAVPDGHAYRLKPGTLAEAVCHAHKRRLELERIFCPGWLDDVRRTAEKVCAEASTPPPGDLWVELVDAAREVEQLATPDDRWREAAWDRLLALLAKVDALAAGKE